MSHPKAATLAALAAIVDGRVVGDPETLITCARTLDEACEGSITLADSDLRVATLADSAATAAVVAPHSELAALPGIEAEDVHGAFAKIVAHFRPQRVATSVARHPSATIAPSARVAPSAQVHAGAVIGNDVEIGERVVVHSNVVVGDGCRVGDDSRLCANVTLYEDVVIGRRCVIHAGAVLGAFGFGYTQRDGRHELCAQLGWVEIADDVEIGAGAAIDRGAYGPTRVGEGTKVDNLVQIAHNCQIGRHNLICSQVGIAGSTTTGDYVVMGGQVGVRDHVTIGDRAVLGAMAGVSNHVPAGARMLGAPATPERNQKLLFAALAKLPSMRKEFKALRQLVTELQASVNRLSKNEDQDAAPERAA